MKTPRRPSTGVVSRKLADNLVVETIFGTKEVSKAFCVTCNEWKLKSEFYLESKSKRKYVDQVRKQCVICWDKYNGNVKLSSDTVSNTVLMFCDGDDE